MEKTKFEHTCEAIILAHVKKEHQPFGVPAPENTTLTLIEQDISGNWKALSCEGSTGNTRF